VDFILNIQVATAVVLAVVTLVGCQFGLLGVGISWAIAFPLLKLIPLVRSLREMDIPGAEYLRAIRAPLVAAGAMSAVLGIAQRLPALPAQPLARLALWVALGVVTYVPILFVADRALGRELREILGGLRSRRAA
jgi:hypothetical protein